MIALAVSEGGDPVGIVYEKRNQIAYITFSNPDKANILDRATSDEISEAWIDVWEDRDIRCAIITGEGDRHFCGGHNLAPNPEVSVDDRAFLRAQKMYWPLAGTVNGAKTGLDGRMGDHYPRVWKPVIAAVNGYCLGFALTLVAACDFVIASDQAQFGFPEVTLGIPTIQGAIRMPKRVGWQNAMELLLLGERVDADRAKEMGLVWKVVPHDELMAEAKTLAERLLKPAPLAIRATKEVASRGQEVPFMEAIRFGETMRRVAGATEDATEGRTARAEGREPDWQAR